MRDAWLTFISTDNYLYYVLNVYNCLKKVGSKHDFYVGLTKNISQATRAVLKKIGIKTLELDTTDVERSGVVERSAKNGMCQRYINALTKLDLIKEGAKHFDKVVYLDSDLGIYANVDELFDKPHMSAVEDIAPAQHHSKYTLGCSVFCSGLFVWDYEKNPGKIEQILTELPKLPKYAGTWHDQNILNYYYQDWKDRKELHLDATYGLMVNQSAIKLFKGEPKIRHYVNNGKEKMPFRNGSSSTSGGLQEYVYKYYNEIADTVKSYNKIYGLTIEPVHMDKVAQPAPKMPDNFWGVWF